MIVLRDGVSLRPYRSASILHKSQCFVHRETRNSIIDCNKTCLHNLFTWLQVLYDAATVRYTVWRLFAPVTWLALQNHSLQHIWFPPHLFIVAKARCVRIRYTQPAYAYIRSYTKLYSPTVVETQNTTMLNREIKHKILTILFTKQSMPLYRVNCPAVTYVRFEKLEIHGKA